MNALAVDSPKAVKPSPSREMGGQHRPPQTSDDRNIMADEDAVALMRDLPAAITEFAPEF